VTAFAGIDFDTHAIHVVGLMEDETAPRYSRYKLEGHDAFERLRGVRDAMPSRGWWNDRGFVAVGIEEPQGIAKSTVAKLKAIQGAVVACLPRDLLVHPMVPARWRTEVGMKGNATKDDVEFWVRFSSPHSISGCFAGCHWPQDAFDAYCLAISVEKLTVPA